jgi:hypothetical protein
MYLTTELARRIDAGMLSKDELEQVFDVADIDITADVGLEPDFDDLAATLRIQVKFVLNEKVADPEIKFGMVELEATLGLLGQSQPLYLRMAYATAKDATVSTWQVLTWPGTGTVPEWSPIPEGLLDPTLVEAAHSLVPHSTP